MRLLVFTFTLILSFLSIAAQARDWDDLYESKDNVFGSEKARRYNPDMFIIERENWEGHYSFMAFWLFKYTNYPKYTSTRLLPLYFGLDSKIDNRSFTFIPIILTYWETDGNDRFKINPLFMSGNNVYDNRYQRETKFSYSLLHAHKSDISHGVILEESLWFPIIPLFYKSTDHDKKHLNIGWLFDYAWTVNQDNSTSVDRLFLLPVFYKENDTYTNSFYSLPFAYKTNYKNNIHTKDNIESSSFWFPIIPMYYHSNGEDGSHNNLLWLVDWKKDENGDLDRFFLIPFVFLKFGEDGYTITPIYISMDQGKESGTIYSPFYYHSWSPTEDKKWTWLIHYKKNNNNTGEYLNTWFPIYYYHDIPSKEKTAWFLPIYYKYDGRESGEHLTRVITPLYWNIETQERDTTLFLPLYFKTKKKDDSDSLYINILGYSRSVLSGTAPIVGAGFGKNQKGVYVDTDVSWLVDVVSISTRTTVPIYNNNQSAAPVSSGQVTLSEKGGGNRDTSMNFWGYRLLFGLTAFQKADSNRHFRLLPLAWLTWDEKSDDKLTVFFPYLAYVNTETSTEYRVIFPVYGYQRIGESYKKGYGINLYWREYDHETQLNEYTVFWPIINIYNSPTKSGWRVLPFVWHKSINEKNEQYSRTISPLFYYKYSQDETTTSKKYFTIIPIIYNNEETYTSSRPKQSVTGDSLSWIFPIYASTEKTYKETAGNIANSDYTLYAPLVYYNKLTSSDKFGATSEQNSLLITGYYRQWGTEFDYTNFFFLYRSKKYHATGDYSKKWLFNLIHTSDVDGRYQRHFRPFYYYENDNGSKELSLLLGTVKYNKDENIGYNSFSMFYGTFKTSHETDTRTAYRTTWLIPIYYYSNEHNLPGEQEYNYTFSLSPLHYSEKTRTMSENSSTFWFPILPLYYSYTDDDKHHKNILGLFDYEQDYNNNNTRFWGVPIVFSKTGDNGYFHIAPLYFSFWDNKNNDYHKIILGLSLHETESYSSQNFLFLFDHTYNKYYDNNEYYLLFSTISFSTATNRTPTEFEILWGLGVDIEWENSQDWSINMLLYLTSFQKNDDDFHSRLLPFWYYDRDRYDRTLVLPPLLTWDTKEQNGRVFQMWGLGALWYRNYKPGENYELQALLMGIPYYKQQKAERGYTSRGSLWGLLWEYETESKTGFRKFSLLKFVYKYTEIDGETRHSILGISF